MTFSGVVKPGFRSKVIPHFGHSPGVSDTTPAHIGQ
jgi:hypothetical protein